MQFEADLIMFLQSSGESWITFFKLVTLFGSWLGFLTVFIYLFFKARKVSLVYAATFLFGVLTNLGVKSLVKRPRPFDSYNTIINFGNESGFSMPSSHAICAAIIAVFVCYVIFKTNKSTFTRVMSVVGMSLYFLFVALSRMVLGVHYLTDVLAGGAVGAIISIVALVLLTLYTRRMERRNGNNKQKLTRDN